MRRPSLCIASVLLSLAVSGGAAAATPPAPGAAPQRLAQAGGDIGPAGAAAAARAATGGRVLDVRGSNAGGRVIYRVKVLLPGGRVRVLRVDGANGRVLG